MTPPQRILLAALRLYQHTLSPDTGWFAYQYPGGVCRFTPTCSAYMAEAVGSFGVIRGVRMGVLRILRCHPWQRGGFDPIRQ
ncbi:MAG: membrane protein insertion efficiency factor YidD [Candidatus Kerfeldbacteria bacterium]|nr:membrane protein insertion efficiency factor YidD [Candidatus Kerfeldbacteria bacterium]